jgi:hypothetical protein
MYVTASRSIAAATSLALLLAPLTAMAQSAQVQVQVQPYQPQQPVYVQQVAPPPPQNAQAGNGEYVAPLQQQTQQTYVPQSVALSGPRVIKDWHEGEPIPPGYHPAQRARTGLIAGGATMFGVPYFISVLVAAGNADSGNANAMYIPVVGPFIQMGNVGGHQQCSSGYCYTVGADASATAVADVFLVLDGALQGAGLAMFIYGLAVPKTVLLRNDLGFLKNVTPVPMVGQNVTGLGLSGQF